MKQQEDLRLYGKAKTELFESITEPNEQQIVAYYEKNKDRFLELQNVKIDQIWCENRTQADKARAELDKGKDFDAVKLKYSLEKDLKPFSTYRSSEGLFWDDVYAGSPGDIVGPIKGFHRDGVNWRIVKIIEKNPGKPLDISTEEARNKVKWQLWSELRYQIMSKKYAELLEKYPYTLYEDRLKTIDPLDIK